MNKNIFCVVLIMISLNFNAAAQTPYVSSVDGSNVTILNGMITKYALINNANFSWFAKSAETYKPDQSVVNALEAAKGKAQLIIFGGTWCEDTQNILPKFFKVQEQSGFPDNSISFFGVDRQKKTLGNMAEAMGITNVPTIIVMKNGKEVGRVVEYGKTGKWDTELAALINQ